MPPNCSRMFKTDHGTLCGQRGECSRCIIMRARQVAVQKSLEEISRREFKVKMKIRKAQDMIAAALPILRAQDPDILARAFMEFLDGGGDGERVEVKSEKPKDQ